MLKYENDSRTTEYKFNNLFFLLGEVFNKNNANIIRQYKRI
jgi:hypothetical protein